MEDKELQHARGGHEEKDVNFVAITKFGIGLTLVVLATVFVLWGLFHFFVGRDEKSYGAGAPLSPEALSALKEPPQPRLQQSPPIDLRDMRAAEDKLLHRYTWVDRDKGVVRIPIERAMDLVVERGLKTRPAGETGQARPPAAGQAKTPVAPAAQGSKQ
jgi:hypothetical protein